MCTRSVRPVAEPETGPKAGGLVSRRFVHDISPIRTGLVFTSGVQIIVIISIVYLGFQSGSAVDFILRRPRWILWVWGCVFFWPPLQYKDTPESAGSSPRSHSETERRVRRRKTCQRSAVLPGDFLRVRDFLVQLRHTLTLRSCRVHMIERGHAHDKACIQRRRMLLYFLQSSLNPN